MLGKQVWKDLAWTLSNVFHKAKASKHAEYTQMTR
uniref:Uncharacterized protein n=1 Tax=Rhizophora mucronata TaxID=61149 RepID=A0A2P2NQN8_RHIMU